MTIKEAVLRSLEERQKPSTYMDVYSHIEEKKYVDFQMGIGTMGGQDCLRHGPTSPG